MATWTFKKYVKTNGRCPIDDWLASKKVTVKDRAKLDTVIEAVEATGLDALFPPEKVKKYKTTDLHEVKATGPGRKQLRPLSVVDRDNGQIVLLCGAIEKDDSLDEIETAQNLAAAWKAGEGSVKDYWED